MVFKGYFDGYTSRIVCYLSYKIISGSVDPAVLHMCLSDNYFSISFQDDSTKSSYRRSLSAGSFVFSGRIFQLFLITGFPVPLFLLRFLVLAVVDWD